MKTLIAALIVLVTCSEINGQDSLTVKITKVKTTSDGVSVVWMKDMKTKIPYITQCKCTLSERIKKGNTVTIANPEIIKVGFTRRDLEN